MFGKKKQDPLDPEDELGAQIKTSWFQWFRFSPVDLAGELLDLFSYWRQSRRWTSVLMMLPVALIAIIMGSLVAVGKLSDPNAKAAWYAERAMKEIELAKAAESEKDTASKDSTGIASKQLPELVDMLFRRVLQINQNNKFARFYVAAQMDRYGSRGSARQIMESLATTKTTGYTKAHTWLAIDLVERAQQGEAINIETLKYHLKRGTSGDEVPPSLLLIYSQLLQQENKTAESQEFLKRAAEFEPKLLLNAIAVYNQNSLSVQARATADMLVEKIKNKLEDNDGENVVLTSQALVLTNRIDEAIEVLQKASKRFPNSSKIAREYSNAYRFKFRATAVRLSDKINVNLDLLNAAIAIDPTNTSVQEELMLLSRLGIWQDESIIDSLRARIATTGTSYIARLLLAETAFSNGKLEDAINEYEVILAELPRMTLALNNLAMMYTQLKPPKIDEAMKLINRAIEAAPNVAEFYDSRGDIFVLQKRKEDAIESYLLALKNSPERVETREKLIATYEDAEQKDNADIERERLEIVKKALDELRARATQAAKQREQSVQPPPTVPSPNEQASEKSEADSAEEKK
jgi:tetratricopeptide (TPR) repeat protein